MVLAQMSGRKIRIPRRRVPTVNGALEAMLDAAGVRSWNRLAYTYDFASVNLNAHTGTLMPTERVRPGRT